jgi:chromosome segregation ATPase
MSALDSFTLAEAERDAYLRNDAAALALLTLAEENAEDYVSPEHEAMVDDRNRLRDALQTCTDRTDAAIEKLDAFNDHDDRLADGALIDETLIESLREAAADAEDALERCDEQIDETTSAKLIESQADSADLRKRLAEAEAELRKARELRDAVRYLPAVIAAMRVRNPKPAPKWAAHLIATLARLEVKP